MGTSLLCPAHVHTLKSISSGTMVMHAIDDISSLKLASHTSACLIASNRRVTYVAMHWPTGPQRGHTSVIAHNGPTNRETAS